MEKQKIKTGAPMPIQEDIIRRNSMKLYTYLVCISGLANYPKNTRIFQQKNLNLAKIKNTIGITNETTKRYLEFLEREGMIQYQGEKYCDLSFKDAWKLRIKNKNEYYRIPRPPIFRVIPEETLCQLNEKFAATEQELKLYMFLLNYQEMAIISNRQQWSFTYEDIRAVLGLTKQTFNNQNINRGLIFLRALGLIDFKIGRSYNSKGAEMPVFVLSQANFYISCDLKDFNCKIGQELTEKERNEIDARIRGCLTEIDKRNVEVLVLLD